MSVKFELGFGLESTGLLMSDAGVLSNVPSVGIVKAFLEDTASENIHIPRKPLQSIIESLPWSLDEP